MSNRLLSGSGVPNGSVYGSPGDSYLDTSGSTNASIWFKNSGSGTNTGWISINRTYQTQVTIASASSISVAGGTTPSNFFQVTGTTNINTITGGVTGQLIILQFTGSLTVSASTNLLINGTFSTAANAVLVLICDGTNYYEISRTTSFPLPNQRFSYTVTGLEADRSELTITLPATRPNNTYLVLVSQAHATYSYGMSVDDSSKTTTQFVLSLTYAASTNDVFNFYVFDANA